MWHLHATEVGWQQLKLGRILILLWNQGWNFGSLMRISRSKCNEMEFIWLFAWNPIKLLVILCITHLVRNWYILLLFSPDDSLVNISYDNVHLSFSFALNTCIESPHSGEIYALEMKPGTEDFHEVMAVTCGDDGKFKIWSLAESAASHGNHYWLFRKYVLFSRSFSSVLSLIFLNLPLWSIHTVCNSSI